MSDDHPTDQAANKTLAGLLMPQFSLESHQELEEFRIEYEAEHGPTDLTKVYTPQLPDEVREWLISNDPERYMDGMPPFGRAYLVMKFKSMVRTKTLDDLEPAIIRLQASGYLRSR